jgi:hypothetical protein
MKKKSLKSENIFYQMCSTINHTNSVEFINFKFITNWTNR